MQRYSEVLLARYSCQTQEIWDWTQVGSMEGKHSTQNTTSLLQYHSTASYDRNPLVTELSDPYHHIDHF